MKYLDQKNESGKLWGMKQDGLNCIDLDLLIIFLSGSTTNISWNKIKNIVSFRENELKTDTIIKLDHFLCEFTPPDT